MKQLGRSRWFVTAKWAAPFVGVRVTERWVEWNLLPLIQFVYMRRTPPPLDDAWLTEPAPGPKLVAPPLRPVPWLVTMTGFDGATEKIEVFGEPSRSGWWLRVLCQDGSRHEINLRRCAEVSWVPKAA